MGCQNCILRVQWHFPRKFFSKNHINWHCERKNSAGFVQTIQLRGKQTILEVVLLDFFPVPARFFKRGLPKLYSTCPEALFAEFFSQNHINWHCERKNSAGFVRTAFYFSEELSSKTILVYYSLPDSSSMGCQNCIPRVQRHFLRNFFHRIIIIGTVNEKNQLVLTDLLSFFPGNFWAKNSRFLVLARFFKHGVPKLYSTCPVALSAEFFFEESY